MKKKISGDLIIGLLGSIYLLFAFLPLIKSLFSKNKINHGNKEEWVEVPLIAEK